MVVDFSDSGVRIHIGCARNIRETTALDLMVQENGLTALVGSFYRASNVLLRFLPF